MYYIFFQVESRTRFVKLFWIFGIIVLKTFVSIGKVFLVLAIGYILYLSVSIQRKKTFI